MTNADQIYCNGCDLARNDYDGSLIKRRSGTVYDPHTYFKQTGERLCERRNWFEQRTGIREMASVFAQELQREENFIKKDFGEVGQRILRAVSGAWSSACTKLFNPGRET